MCGLAGLWTTGGGSVEALRADAGRMIAPLVHRGPDDEGIWADASAGIALGFRRLAIVDRSPHGHQPMSSPSGRFTMVFNGEVYNAATLARELAAYGYRFRGHSDTEVMLAAIEQWGIARAVERFVGMFSIAVWDERLRALHLVRDRLGKKPLFVWRGQGMIAFASELKALMALPSFPREIDPAALSAYLRFFYVPAPHSIFRDTRKVLPGSILTTTDAGAPLPADVPFWSAGTAQAVATTNPFMGSDAEAIDETERLLAESTVMRAGHSDVPVGAFLSGGIDSTAVVALMQKQASRPVKTYTIGFADDDYDESRHAEAIARHLGTDHTTLVLTPGESQSVVPDLAEMFDEPFADISQIPTHLVSRLARQHVTVALSGDGGDEVFGGYNRYVWGNRVFRGIAGVPGPARRLVGRGLRSVPPRRWDRAFGAVSGMLPRGLRYRLPGEKLHKIGALMATESPSQFYRSLVSAWREPGTVSGVHAEREGTFERVMDAATPRHLIDRMMLADLLTYLPDNNLAKVDRASMAVSLEVRVPMLDHRVVEWALRLPLRMKIRGAVTKWVLRQVLYRHVPRALVEREKMGFDVPIGTWLRGPLREWASDLLHREAMEQDGLLRASEVRRVWREHLAGRANHGRGLWVVLMLQAWRARWAC
ncbi:MAG: asparagine synthase (glutamine-hydrolyzing) [Gemmatimonadaceae bacterium]